MPDSIPWSSLKDDVLSLLKESVHDLVNVEKDDVKAFLSDIAEQGAKQSWLLLNGTDDEKAQAPVNLKSLKAQAVIWAADAVILASKELKAAFVKAIETAGLFLLKYAPQVLAAI